MNSKNTLKKVFASILSFSFTLPFFAQNTVLRSADLSSLKPSWQAVIGGESLAPVAETSYGFAVITDGRMISTCTYKGSVMWQKGIKGRGTKYFTSYGDFLYAVTDGSVLNFINPGGKTLWSTDAGFKITASPFCGRDGRVFVLGEHSAACYGLKGSEKWKVTFDTPLTDKISELPDGSLLVYNLQTSEGKTQGTRLSPFGETLEQITFAGEIVATESFRDGVLMSFADGSFGLCTTKKNAAVSKWVSKKESASPVKAIIASGEKSALFYNTGTELNVLIIKNKTGELLKTFLAGTLSLNEISSLRATSQGFYISDSFRAIECTSDGTILWEARLPSRSKWNYVSYTNTNQILLCMKDWTLNAFVMRQGVSGKKSTKKAETAAYTTPSKKTQIIDGVVYSSIPSSRIEQIKSAFESKNFGTQEKEMLENLQEIQNSYIEELYKTAKNSREDSSFFSKNPLYTNPALQAMTAAETDIFTAGIAAAINLEKDPLMTQILIAQAGKMQYDRDGELLKALEQFSSKKLTRKDVKTAQILCDATYRIVEFMGRPAFYRQGRQIISSLMTAKFDQETRNYASTTFQKIINLEN